MRRYVASDACGKAKVVLDADFESDPPKGLIGFTVGEIGMLSYHSRQPGFSDLRIAPTGTLRSMWNPFVL